MLLQHLQLKMIHQHLKTNPCMKKFGIIASILLLSQLIPSSALAYKTLDAGNNFLNKAVEPTGLSTADLQTSTGQFIQAALLLVGTVFLGLMIYGGFTWMTAKGAEDKITKAKETVVAAAIGIVIILAAYAATNFVTENLIQGANSPANACGEANSACLAACDALPEQALPNCRQNCDNALIACINP